ncbi:MAG TPA: 23S rRNA (uracil(1939)-C(5))-methyltransferase RlmD [Spirochaetota bacterium]|nr:23S rRNA (uracil(1939)-C(5))-methyltransferase RlmD [Spirochaetota bacterium]HQO40546.1 23S rRNA (uracil(1939)-C(5))-methyltransferase RlmD [Spirochaetota bacterium]
MKKKKRKYFVELMDRHTGGGCDPECPHFGECGGCMFQHIPYENQLLLKKEYLNNLLDGITIVDYVEPGTPYGYRNRMDMVCAFGKKGLRMQGRYRQVVDIQSCAIMQSASNDKFIELRNLLSGIEDYDYLQHSGYLRYIVLRQARFTGQVMTNFVVSVPENRFGFILYDFLEGVDSSSILLSDGLADLSFGPVHQTLKKGFITESFDGIEYMITPNSFFQSNSEVALAMYRKIKSWTSGRTLDLYSGVGSISLFVSSAAEKVTGVEIVQESVDTARKNAENNKIDNVNFFCADTLSYVKDNSASFDTLILDPPRSGMHPKMIKEIRNMKLDRIIYMSCNPSTFRDDVKALEEWEIETFEAYDMFPQTPHVETLALLKRKQ